ncbi:MAG: hypothetical protein K2Q23_20040 [Bryobacteraceae bacterium]|nr:hypothetical protein [Bryobacteraceae bacterium]
MVLTKQELIACLQKEVRILVHLCGKVEPGMVDYRPTEKQRSTVELLRYLTLMGPVLVKSIRGGSFLAEEWGAGLARTQELEFGAVVKELEGQAALYETELGSWSDAELREEIELFGNKGSRGSHIVDWVVCGHAAYRTQLFCYLKSCGRAELGTMNLWGGMDAQG